jgi:hypothetical protein
VKDGKAAENRRVAFILIDESKFFPIHFPCQDGNEAGCQGQCKKAGKRATAGVKCAFYDELVRETHQEPADESASHSEGFLKKGDKGPVVEELNIRLSGFGGGTPKDVFDDETESKVKQFQQEWMKKESSSGILDSETASAIDAFADAYPLDINIFRCKCGKCQGFGNGRHKGEYSGSSKSESRHKYEYPGIHRSLAWALRGIEFRAKTLHLNFHGVTSGYRCWEDNKFHRRSSTNHMGKAMDLSFYDSSGKNSGKAGCDKIRNQIVEKMHGQVRWKSPDRFSMEPSEASYDGEYLATTWVHIDVREFQARFLDDRFFCKTTESLNGKSMRSLLGK